MPRKKGKRNQHEGNTTKHWKYTKVTQAFLDKYKTTIIHQGRD